MDDSADSSPVARDAALWAVASAQDGVITGPQLAQHGVAGRAVLHRVASGRLFRVHRGVFSLMPPAQLTPAGRKRAAVYATGRTACLSHRVAVHHIGLVTGSTPREIEVTVASRAGRAPRDGIRVHRSATLRDSDRVAIYGIPCTTPARTILDVAAEYPPRELESLIDAAYRLDLADRRELEEQLAHNGARKREAFRLRTVLATHDAIGSLTDNDLEKRLFTALRDAGIPLPQPQVWIDPGDGGARIRADFLYLIERLIIETDGWRFHGHRREGDSLRDQRAARAGLRTLRITRRQVVEEIDRVVSVIADVYTECHSVAVALGRCAPDARETLWVPPGTTVRIRQEDQASRAA